MAATDAAVTSRTQLARIPLGAGEPVETLSGAAAS